MYAKYEGASCSGTADCESKCTSGCSGYSKTPSETVVVQVSMGTNFGCALHSDGTVKCWGANTYGQLGDGSTTTRTTPVDVTLDSAAIRVECGMYHTCAILDTGKVQCWGRNNYGQLGIESTTTQKTPVTVLHIDGANDLSLGQEHTCVLINTDAKCWGRNSYGALGIGSTATTGDGAGEMTLEKIDIDAVKQITTGRYFTCALTVKDEVKCWGYGAKGQLGNGLTTNIGDAANEMGDNLAVTLTGVHKVAAAIDSVCAVMKDLTVRCWGLGGRIGYDDTTQRNTPGSTVYMGGKVVDINGGTDTFCAVFDDGKAKCWGNGDHGKLGITGHQGDAAGEMEALPFIDLSATGSDCWMIATGGSNTCALVDGELNCFGLSNLGQNAGNGLGANTATYTYTYGSKTGLIGISTQLTDTCAPCKANEYVESQYVEGAYTVEAGQTSYTCDTLAECKPQCDADPNCVGYSEDAGLEVVKIGYSFSYAENVLYSDGTVKCFAKLGYSASCGTDDGSTFYDPADSSTWGTTKLSGPAVDMSRWGNSDGLGGCAVMTDGTLECWCNKNYGTSFKFVNGNSFAGDGNNPMADNRLLDTGVYRFRNFTGGIGINCGILRGDHEGQLACWGWYISKNSNDPFIINQGTVTHVSCGRYFCCYIIGGQVSCFGANAYGQLGIESTSSISMTTVSSSSTIAAVDIGTHVAAKVFCSWKSTRVVTTNGDLIGWGSLTNHDLGYNDADYTFGSNQGDEPGEMGANLIVTLTNVKESHGRRQYSNSAVQNDGTLYWTHRNTNGWASFTNTKMKTSYTTYIESVVGLTVNDNIALFDGSSDAVSETPAYSPTNIKNIGLQCVACTSGTYNSPGDTTEGTCDDAITCDANFYSDGTQCVACPEGTISNGASVIDGHSYCKRLTPCGIDEYVNQQSVCALCAFGTFSDPIATEYTDTPCQKPAGTCGENEHSSIQYFETDNRYTGGSCTDCETACTNDANCLGYTKSTKIVAAISTRGYTCTASDEGVKCWGRNTDNGLGIGQPTSTEVLREDAVLKEMSGVKALRSAYETSRNPVFAIMHDGTARCWGYNYVYCGYSVSTDVTVPGPNIYAHGGKIKDIRGHWSSVMMLLEDGRIFAWGDDFAQGRNYETNSPLDIGGLATAISKGDQFSCALIDAKVKCWGNHYAGQEVSSSTASPDLPFLKGLTKPVVDIQSGRHSTCALFNDGTVKCWGTKSGFVSGGSGIVGDAAGEMEAEPFIDISGVVELSAGETHYCARLDTGGLKCFGYSLIGRTGNGLTEMTFDAPIDRIFSGRANNFVAINGNLKSFGYNAYNMLGHSGTTDVSVSNAAFVFPAEEIADGTYGPITSSGRGMAKRSSCGTCPANTTRPAGDSLSEATWCISETTCGKDEFMNTNYECEPCPEGVFNNPGDNSPGICNDQAVCTENQHVSNGICLDCPANTTNPAGDDTNNGNTYCTLDVACGQNEFVNYQHQCTACPEGLYNDVGDNTVGTCDDTEKCLSGYHVKTTFESDNLKKFGSTPCDNVTDCETKCLGNSTCGGYTVSDGGWTNYSRSHFDFWNYATFAVSGNFEVIVAMKGGERITLSYDNGVTWGLYGPAASSDNPHWAYPSVSKDGSVIAVGRYDEQIALSTDGGSTWSWVGPTMRHSATGVSGDGNTIVAAGTNTKIHISKDKGQTWSESYSTNLYAYSVEISYDGSVINVAGKYANPGNIISRDGGTTWETSNHPRATYGMVAMSDDGTIMVGRTTNPKAVYISTDTGETWSQTAFPAHTVVGEAITSDGQTIAIAERDSYGTGGYIWISTDGGQTWNQHPNSQNKIYRMVMSRDAKSFFIRDYSDASAVYLTPELSYGPQITGVGTSFVKNKGCKLCPAGYNNEPMDDPLLDDTTCDFIPCVEDHKVVDGVCTPCVLGSTRPAGDADPLVNTYCFCGINQHVVDNVCTECPTGSTNDAGDDESGPDTHCMIAPCAKDYHVQNDVCVPCPDGFTNDAGDTNENGDTFCDATFVCLENQYVSNNQCVDCTVGTAPYGADPGGPDTVCVCGKNEYFDGAACQPCGYGTFNDAGSPVDQVGTCDGLDVCEIDEHVSLKFVLHTGQQISNADGYGSPQTDFEKAKRLCVADEACKGLTKDGSNYYLSDGTMSANAVYDAYLIYRDEYMCAPCPGTGSRVAGDVADALSSCSFTTCAAEEGVEDFVCTPCTGGKIQPTPLNPVVGNQACYTPPCLENEYASGGACVACPTDASNEAGDLPDDGDTICDFGTCGKDEYVSNHACVPCATGFNDPGDWRGEDSTCDDIELCDANEYGLTSSGYVSSSNKYEGTSCSDSNDCETKCTADPSCDGYSNTGFSTIKAWGDSTTGGTDPGVINNVVDIVDVGTGMIAIKADGTAQAWGALTSSSITNVQSWTGVKKVVKSMGGGFAALFNDGTVSAEGHPGYGGDEPSITDAVDIVSTSKAFAVLKSDGSVVSWGDATYGGTDPGITSGVTKIFSNNNAFAALKTDGSVHVWGNSARGGADPGITSGVVKIFSNNYAFAALKDDGSVQVWGDASYGGTDPGITSGVVKIISTQRAFAALKDDGSVQVWGDASSGGTDPGITSGVVNIISNVYAFAALKTDGTVTVWGMVDRGGCDSGAGTSSYSCKPSGLSNVESIVPAKYAFAALKSDGSVAVWGFANWGNDDPGITSGVTSIYSTDGAFAALKTDGSVQVWGDTSKGGTDPGITSGVDAIYSSSKAFIAVGPSSYAYGPLVSGSGSSTEKSVTQTCVSCPGVGTNPAARVNESTPCTFPNCQTDQYSLGDGACLPCPAGRTMPTPVNPTKASQCLCATGERAVNGSCVACPAGFTNEAGDSTCDICYDTGCDFIPCAKDHYVAGTGYDRVCTPCPAGTFSPGGTVTECGALEYCDIDEKSVGSFGTVTNIYGNTPCTDCASDCSSDPACEGYTTTQVHDVYYDQDSANYLINDGSIQYVGQDNYELNKGVNLTLKSIDCYRYLCLGVMPNASVVAWGKNTNGMLGANYEGIRNQFFGPMIIPELQGATEVIVGGYPDACARISGTIQCLTIWDRGLHGVTHEKTCASKMFSCYINSGTVYCAGKSGLGQTGLSYSNYEDWAATTITNAVDISCGDSHACALLSDGTVKCWGNNDYGQVGHASATKYYGAYTVATNAKQVSCAFHSTCVIASTDEVQCIGSNLAGQLGTGSSDANVHYTLENTGIYAKTLFAGERSQTHCAIKTDDTFACWGEVTQLPVLTSTYGTVQGTLISGTSNGLVFECVACPEGFENQHGNTTLKGAPNGVCVARTCNDNEYSDGTVCQPCPQYTGAVSAGLDPTQGATQCVPTTCQTDEHVVNNVCTPCDANSYRLAGDQIFGGDTHCFCRDNQKVINKACVACEEGSSNPNLCYSGLEDHYCVCHENYHVVSNLCTACPAGATRPAGDYAGNGDTHCFCGENQHVVNNECVACPAGTTKPAGDDSSGPDTECSCVENEHMFVGYVTDTNKYEGTSCTDEADCETKCTADSTCEGYTKTPAAFNMVDIAGVSVGWYSVAMSGNGQTIVVGGYTSNLWVSTDGGNSWNEDTSIGQAHPYKSIAISADGQYVAAAAYNSFQTPYLFYSTDYGATFTQKNFAYSRADGIAISDDGQIIAVAHNSANLYNIPVSTDGGDTWTDGNQGGQWRSIAMSADGTKMIACEYSSGTGYVWLSDDTGATWSNTGSQKSWKGVSMSADGSKMVAMASGELLFCSSNCGSSSNWVNIEPTWDIAQFPTISRDGSTIIIGGGSGGKEKVYTSTDDGATWTTYTTENTQDQRNTDLSADGSILAMMSKNQVGMWLHTGQSSLEYGSLVAGTGDSKIFQQGCQTCPTGSVRPAGDLLADGATSCACPENFHVSGGQCVACVAGTRPAGDDPAVDTHCSCLENHRVQDNVCTACPEGQERLAGDDAGGNNTACTCKQNYYSTGSGCALCTEGAIIGAGSDPLVPSQCTCSDGYEPNGALCDACADTEQSGFNTSCVCKENHHYDGSACVACAPGSIRPAGDDKLNVTVCEAVICAENQRVLNNECVNCLPGMVRPAGDEASGIDTICGYEGTAHTVSTAGLYAFRIDTLPNNGELVIRAGETHSFYRVSGGDPFRIVTEADCEGKECNKAKYTSLPTSSLGLTDAEDEVAVTVFTPDTAGLYYYVSTETPYRKGRIVVDWAICTITYPVTNISSSCELSGEETLTGDLTIQFVTEGLRAQQGEVPQIKAAEGARHFTVSGGFKLTISDIDLNGGRGTEGGSILVDNGEIDANNVKFTDNVASLQGGAIRVKNAASKIKLSNILFQDNQGTEGGAIATDTLTEPVEIHASEFKANRAAAGDGGAIKSDAVINITGTNFEANFANSGEGGGISATKDLTISGSSFKSNKALRGGALKSEENTVTMSNMVVEANEAVEDGGAFLAKNAEFDVRTSTILANKAKRGAAFKTSFTGCTTDCKKLRIQSSSMEDNEATIEGGAVDFDADANAEPQFWIQDTEMKNNKARGQANDFKQRGDKVKIKAIDSDIGNIDGGAVDKVCEPGQCAGRAESTCEVTETGTECACDGTNKHLSGGECKVHKVCTGLGLDVEIRAPDKKHDRLCGTQDIADLSYKLDDKGKELAELIEAKLVAEGVAADQAYALAVEVFGEINKCN